jgi:flagellar biosynthesis regulator FlaF
MTAAEIAAGVQFTVDQQGQVTAVVLTPALWQQIVEALEDAEDRELVRSLRARLAAGPAASGALRWREVADEWA